MAISLIGSTITIDSGVSSGTATGGTSNTLTGTGFGSWANRIVWITSGTGAGQSRFIRSATSTSLTVEPNWDITPTSSSTFSIGYTWADIDLALAGVTTSSTKFYLVPYSLSLLAGGFIGSVNEDVRFTASVPSLTTASGSLWQQGRLLSSGVATNGGTVELAFSLSSGFSEQSMLGLVRWYGTMASALGTGAGNYRINDAASGDGLDFRYSNFNNIYNVVRSVDRMEKCVQNTRPLWPKSAVAPVLLNNSYIENSFIINGDGGAGANNHYFGLTFDGIPQDSIFSKPFWVWNTTTKEGTYFWDVSAPAFATTAHATSFYSGMPVGAGFYTGKTVSVTTKKTDGTALGGVTIGLWDANGDAAWFEGVDGTTGRPINSLTITTNSGGTYSNPWPAVSGKSGLVVAERVKQLGTTVNATMTSYSPWTLRARKYGYFEVGGARNFSNSSTETIFQAIDTKQTADGTAVTGVNINYTTSTIALTSNNSIENVNNYLKYSLIQNITKNDFTSYLGSAFNIGSGVLTGLEFLSANSVFDEIISTSAFTASGSFNNIKVTGNINQNTPTNLTGVVHTGTLTYNTNSNITITMTNCTLGTVKNNGTGTVNVKKINSTMTDGTRVMSYIPTFINFALNGGRVRILDNSGVEQYNQTTDISNVELPQSATGTWTYKITKYGQKPITGSFTIDGTTKTITAFYIPDTNVIDTLANVSAYTSLENAQKIYDYINYYSTTSAGIVFDFSSIVKSFGAIDFGAINLTLNPSATNLLSFATNTLTLKTSLTGADTYYSTGDFTLGTATLSNDIRIRFANLNSELVLTAIDSLQMFPTSNKDSANLAFTITTPTYRFLYGQVISGVTMSNTLYTKAISSGEIVDKDYVIATGNNQISLSQLALINIINAKVTTTNDNLPKVNRNVIKASKLIPAGEIF